MWAKTLEDGVEILTAENEFVRCAVAPATGGKIVSIFNKQLEKEFLWRNERLALAAHKSGTDYDSNFYGGIDELIPNDIPENVDGINYPDHGELWTTRLEYVVKGETLEVAGMLPLSKLFYRKTIELNGGSVIKLSYTIKNMSAATRHFLWKLHAALQVKEGDQLTTGAKKGKVADAAYSRFSSLQEFDWPLIEATDASVVPAKNDTMDFFFLYEMPDGEMTFLFAEEDAVFSYRYDKNIFPYQWYFASYGKFMDHYTVVLEPCSTMPLSVNEAKQFNQCSVLRPGEEMSTVVNIYAGLRKVPVT